MDNKNRQAAITIIENTIAMMVDKKDKKAEIISFMEVAIALLNNSKIDTPEDDGYKVVEADLMIILNGGGEYWFSRVCDQLPNTPFILRFTNVNRGFSLPGFDKYSYECELLTVIDDVNERDFLIREVKCVPDLLKEIEEISSIDR